MDGWRQFPITSFAPHRGGLEVQWSWRITQSGTSTRWMENSVSSPPHFTTSAISVHGQLEMPVSLLLSPPWHSDLLTVFGDLESFQDLHGDNLPFSVEVSSPFMSKSSACMFESLTAVELGKEEVRTLDARNNTAKACWCDPVWSVRGTASDLQWLEHRAWVGSGRMWDQRGSQEPRCAPCEPSRGVTGPRRPSRSLGSESSTNLIFS